MPLPLPRIGLGTWENTNPEECASSVSAALSLGYTFIDTAQIYRNEKYVGTGIAKAGIAREELTVATKVWVSNLTPSKVIKSTEESLKKLGLDYIDILYVHWPAGSYNAEKTLPAFSELADQGKIKHIAVSNFTVPLLEEAVDICDKPILANQVEMHPLLKQEDMVHFTKTHNMFLIAYSPLARGYILTVPEIDEIAQKHGVSKAQVSLAWLLTHDHVIPVPKATSRRHIESNLQALQVALDKEDIEKIESMTTEKRFVDPKWAPWH
jgi:2,5-diketo-D-gluconate reductase B